MGRTPLTAAAPAIVLALATLAPFHDKAFTIDDTVFLMEARHAVVDPLHPTAFEMAWTEAPARLSSIVPTGPVMAWLLVPAVLSGDSESIAHAVQLALLALAILATVSLGIRLGLTPHWAGAAGLLLAATPTALAMAGTAMPDVPAMALGAAGMERLVAWRQDRRLHQGIVAALLLGLAPMTRTHLVLVYAIALLVLVGDFLERDAWRRLAWARSWPLGAAGAVALVIAVATRDAGPGSGSIVDAANGLSGADEIVPNAIAFAVHWVAALPFAVPWLVLRRPGTRPRWWVFLGAMVAMAGLLMWWYELPAPPLPLALLAAIGTVAVVDVLRDAVVRRDSVQLALGLWLLLPLPVVAYVQFPSKYLLVSAPAAVLLVARAMAGRTGAAPRWVLGITVAAGLALGIAILRADAAFAGLGRRAAAALIAPQVAAGKRVWFVGHWGFQWYAQQAGARCVTTTPPYPAPGDIVVASQNSEPLGLVERIPWRTHLARMEDRTPGGRIMSREAGAGFFGNRWGYLPWVWGDDVIDAFDVWRIDVPPQRIGSTRAPQ